MQKNKRFFLFAIIVLCILLFITSEGYANTAEPPSLIIILHNAPKDTVISISTDDLFYKKEKRSIAWEDYYIFYYGRNTHNEIILQISNSNKSYEVVVYVDDLKGYQSTLTLDYPNQIYIPGKLFIRSLLLVFIRLIFTLLIEGIMFYAFGYRKK